MFSQVHAFFYNIHFVGVIMIVMGREDTNIGVALDQEENQETDQGQGLALALVKGRGILIVLNVTFSCVS